MLTRARSAPEALDRSQYSHASDVWSYGVVCWEVFTYGSNPYKWLSNQEVVEQVAKGLRLPKPDGCPDLVWSIVMTCWEADPSKRPSFAQLSKDLKLAIPKILNKGDEMYDEDKVDDSSRDVYHTEKSTSIYNTKEEESSKIEYYNNVKK